MIAMLRRAECTERVFWKLFTSTSYYYSLVNVVCQTVLGSKGDKVRGKAEGNIMLLKPWDSKNNWVVTQSCNKHWQMITVLKDAEYAFSNVSDVTVGYLSSINNFQNLENFQGFHGKAVIFCEVLVHKGITNYYTIYQGMHADFLAIDGKSTSNNEIVSIQ